MSDQQSDRVYLLTQPSRVGSERSILARVAPVALNEEGTLIAIES